MCSGIGISRLPRALSRLDLPQPFCPMSPYRLHDRYAHSGKLPETHTAGKSRVSLPSVVIYSRGACPRA